MQDFSYSLFKFKILHFESWDPKAIIYDITSDILIGPNKAAVSINGSNLVLAHKVGKQTNKANDNSNRKKERRKRKST